MLLKLSNFIPSKEYLEWLKSCTCVQQLDKAVTTAKLADEAVTADKIASALKSIAIADLDGTANLADVITAINSILAVLRTAGIIASS